MGKIKMARLKINREQFAIFFVVTVLLIVSVLGMYSHSPIDRYRSKSEDESQIIELLIMFQKARMEYHLDNYLSCLSDEGTFMFGGSIMVSKKELKKLLPSFWSDLRSNRLKSTPSSREELNGNFFVGGFYDPVIKVSKDKAKSIITFVTPVTRWTTKLFLNFQRYNDSWKITRLEWDMG